MHRGESRGQVFLQNVLTGPRSQADNLRWAEAAEQWQRRAVVEQQAVRGDGDVSSDGGNSEESGRIVRPNSRGTGKKRSKFAEYTEKVETLLKKYTPCPPISIKHLIPVGHRDFDKELLNPRNKDIVQAGCDIYSLELNWKSLSDFKDLYNAAETPTFYARDLDIFSYYHDRETSLNFLTRLIEFQIGDYDEICIFLQNLVNLFDRKGWDGNPKINALICVGPPNSGKNYFFDTWASIACNVGHIGSVNNKTNTFAFQDIVNRRLVVGNEINMEPNALEDFKKICEGAACNVKVKHKSDAIFSKTPVLLMSNMEPHWATHPHFLNVRLHTIRWQTANFLKDSNKKPYPLSLFDLLDKYNIQY